MLSLKTPLAFIISIVIALIAYFVANSLAASSIAVYLPSIISVLTVIILVIVSSLIHSNAQPSKARSETTTSPKPAAASNSANNGELTTLYIGNLAYKANEKLVEEYFATIGKVISVRLVKDKKTGRRKGFGFVEVGASDEALFIDKLNESEFMERNIIVRPANEKKH